MAALSSAVADVHHEHPEVPVTTVAVPDRPVEALLARAEDAELLVVGRHGRARSALPLGSVAHAAAYYAACSVAVVGAR